MKCIEVFKYQLSWLILRSRNSVCRSQNDVEKKNRMFTITEETCREIE